MSEFHIEVCGKSYKAGNDERKALNLMWRIAEAKRVNIRECDDGLYICWNNHKKGEKCEYIKEIDYSLDGTISPGDSPFTLKISEDDFNNNKDFLGE